MADKGNPSPRGMAIDTGIKVKASVTGFKPSTGGSAIVKSGASSRPVAQASAGISKKGDSSKG